MIFEFYDIYNLVLTLLLPNATVVGFTVHCQTQLQSKFKGTVDRCLILTVIRDANLCTLFQNVQSYMDVSAIFCTIMDFTKMFEMPLDFVDIKNIKNMSMGITYRTHLAHQLLDFDLFLIKQYIRINPDV